MPSFNVKIDVNDIFDKVSDSELLQETKRRNKRKSSNFYNRWDAHFTEPTITKTEAREALDSISISLRRGGSVNMAAKLDEIRLGYFYD